MTRCFMESLTTAAPRCRLARKRVVSISEQQHEERSEFQQVPGSLTPVQALEMLEEAMSLAYALRKVSPGSLDAERR